jgi:hypothetical protein
MADWATIAAVASAFGAGGVLGGLLTATHERTERFRERMILAAEDFLKHTGEARRHLTLAGKELRAGDPRGEAENLLATAALHGDHAYHQLAGLAVMFPRARDQEGDVVDSARRFVAAILEKRDALQAALINGDYATSVAPSGSS